jgi:hypothetical protein
MLSKHNQEYVPYLSTIRNHKPLMDKKLEKSKLLNVNKDTTIIQKSTSIKVSKNIFIFKQYVKISNLQMKLLFRLVSME